MKIRVFLGKILLGTIGRMSFEKCRFAKFLRRCFARLISKKISKKSNIHKGAKITGNGKNLTIEEFASIGINSQVGSNCKIGRHTMMGPECLIITENHKYDKNKNIFDGFETKEVIIGEYCWIGQRSIILPGAIIGNHCIVGAGSVVTNKKFPDYSLIAGNPAVVKKSLK